MTRIEAATPAERLRTLLQQHAERRRQRALIRRLGQVTCWDQDANAHHGHYLPCSRCGAAL